MTTIGREILVVLPTGDLPLNKWAAEELLARVGLPYRIVEPEKPFSAGAVTLAIGCDLEPGMPGLKLDCKQPCETVELARSLADGQAMDRYVKQVEKGQYHLCFDLASAYLDWLGRREEVGNPQPDKHARVRYENTAMARAGLGQFPSVDALAKLVGDLLVRVAIESGTPLPERRQPWEGLAGFVVHFSHDVDTLDGKTGLWKRYLWWAAQGLAKIARGDLSQAGNFWRRIRHWHNTTGDPQYTIRKWMDLEDRYGARSSFYFMCSRSRSARGKMIWRGYSLLEQRVQADILLLEESGWETGVHGLYRQYRDPAGLSRQKGLLESVSGIPARGARQHFLRVHQYDTLRALAQCGFDYDASIGWSEHIGCRAATVQPYRVWDAESHKALDIWEIPLLVMDGALDRVGPDADSKMDAINSLWEACRRYNGVFSLLIHPERLDGYTFPSWPEFAEVFLGRCRGEGAAVLPGRTVISRLREFRKSLRL